MDRKKALRLALVPLFLYAFYSIGFPLEYLVVLGIILILVIFFRDTFYTKIEGFLVSRFPAIGRLPSWARKLLVITIFIMTYFLIKQFIFFSLKMAGLDVEKILTEGINRATGS